MRPTSVRTVMVVVVLMLVPATSLAQLPSSPEIVAAGRISDPNGDTLARWSSLYDDHRKWDTLQQELKQALKQADLRVKSTPQTPNSFIITDADFGNNHYSLVFPRIIGEKVEGVRVLLHTPTPEAYSNRIEGVKEIYDVAIVPTEASTVRTRYASTRLPNAMEEKLADFVKQFDLAKVFGVLAPFAAPAAPTRYLYVVVSRVALPAVRLSIKVTDAFSIAPPPVLTEAEAEAVFKAAQALHRSSLTRAARSSECARATADALFKSVKDLTTDAAGLPRSVEREEVQKAISAAYDETVTRCGSIKDSAAALVDNQAVMAIETQFLATVATPKAREGTLETTYENTPREKWAFGAMTAFMVAHEESGTRAKVADGKIVADPLSGTTTLALVTYRPNPTDPKAVDFPGRERWFLFVGGSLTPEFGVAVGGGWSWTRKISVAAGVSALRIDVARSGETIGSAPVNAKRPLRDSFAGTAFLGFAYTF